MASPPYTAVIVWLPALKPVVVKVASPLTFRVAMPRTVAPSLKITVPVGVPVPLLTATVKVAGLPISVVEDAEPSVVAVAVCCTISFSVAELLGA